MTTTVYKHYAAIDTYSTDSLPDIVIMGSEIFDLTKNDDDKSGRCTIDTIRIHFDNKDDMQYYDIGYTFTSPDYATAQHTFNSRDRNTPYDAAITSLLKLKYPNLFLPVFPPVVSQTCWIRVTKSETDTVTVYEIPNRPAPSGHSILELCLKALNVDLEGLGLEVEMLILVPTDVDDASVKTYNDLKAYILFNIAGLD